MPLGRGDSLLLARRYALGRLHPPARPVVDLLKRSIVCEIGCLSRFVCRAGFVDHLLPRFRIGRRGDRRARERIFRRRRVIGWFRVWRARKRVLRRPAAAVIGGPVLEEVQIGSDRGSV